MKRAAQAATLRQAFQSSERQVGAAVRAVTVQQAPGARCVLEQHQVLPQQLDGLDRSLLHARVKRWIEFVHQRGGLPVLAHQLAAWRAGRDAGDQFILFSVHGGALKRSVVEMGGPVSKHYTKM